MVIDMPGSVGLGREWRTGSYGGVFLAGIASAVWTPTTIASELSTAVMWAWSFFLVVGGLWCFCASLTQRYLVEWPGLWVIITGIGLYLTALWSISLGGELSRLTQTILITSYAVYLVSRTEHLRLLAGALRK